jgi:hypothetical protein
MDYATQAALCSIPQHAETRIIASSRHPRQGRHPLYILLYVISLSVVECAMHWLYTRETFYFQITWLTPATLARALCGEGFRNHYRGVTLATLA